MSLALQGAILGLLAATGVVLVVLSAPPFRRPRLGDRLAPYLSDAPRPSRLLTSGRASSQYGAAGRLLQPVLEDARIQADCSRLPC
jgi:tight adherence protein C